MNWAVKTGAWSPQFAAERKSNDFKIEQTTICKPDRGVWPGWQPQGL